MIITYNTLDPVTWTKVLRFDLSQLAIFKIQVAAAEVHMPYLASLLSTKEMARAKRYHAREDQHRFVVSRAVARIILGMYTTQEPTTISFTTGNNHKPSLANGADVQYNIAHSKNYVLLAVSGTEVGIDIERLDPSFCFQDVLQHSFTLSEQAAIADQKNTSRALFYRSWTRKEALVKATGQGIDADFPRIPSFDGQHLLPSIASGAPREWVVSSFMVSADYIAALAHPASALRLNKTFYCVDSNLWA